MHRQKCKATLEIILMTIHKVLSFFFVFQQKEECSKSSRVKLGWTCSSAETWQQFSSSCTKGKGVQAAASPCALKIWYLKELSREKKVVASIDLNSQVEKRVHLILKQEMDFILDSDEDNHSMQNLKVLVRILKIYK